MIILCDGEGKILLRLTNGTHLSGDCMGCIACEPLPDLEVKPDGS